MNSLEDTVQKYLLFCNRLIATITIVEELDIFLIKLDGHFGFWYGLIFHVSYKIRSKFKTTKSNERHLHLEFSISLACSQIVSLKFFSRTATNLLQKLI